MTSYLRARKEVGPNVIKSYRRREVSEAMFLFVGPYSENKKQGGNVTRTVAIQQLPVGKLEHGHNDKLPKGWERSGSQCDKTILKTGPEAMFLFVGPYSENKKVGGNMTRTVAIQ